jgi:signal transduction histidine kinase
VITDSTEALLRGDRDRLGQVVTNLLTNAIKYSLGTDPIDVLVASTPETLTISVRDYGVGIPPEQQSRIFERFYRAQNPAQASAPGFGMGLYISREIVKRHGGQITVDSEEGKGSTFTVVLPLKK